MKLTAYTAYSICVLAFRNYKFNNLSSLHVRRDITASPRDRKSAAVPLHTYTKYIVSYAYPGEQQTIIQNSPYYVVQNPSRCLERT